MDSSDLDLIPPNTCTWFLGPMSLHSLHPKRHLDRFSRFYLAYPWPAVRQTDRHRRRPTDQAANRDKPVTTAAWIPRDSCIDDRWRRCQMTSDQQCAAAWNSRIRTGSSWCSEFPSPYIPLWPSSAAAAWIVCNTLLAIFHRKVQHSFIHRGPLVSAQ